MNYNSRNIACLAKVNEILKKRLVLVVRCSSLGASDTFLMKEKMWDLEGNFSMVKNSLAKIAFANCGFDFLSDELGGSVALAYCDGNVSPFLDMVFGLANKYGPSKFAVLSGKCDSQFFSLELMSKVALFPDESYVYLDLVDAIRSAASSITSLLNGPARLLSHYLDVHASGVSSVDN